MQKKTNIKSFYHLCMHFLIYTLYNDIQLLFCGFVHELYFRSHSFVFLNLFLSSVRIQIQKHTTKRKNPQRISESVDLIPATPPLLYTQQTVADGFAKAYFPLSDTNRAKVKLDENMPCRETTVTAVHTIWTQYSEFHVNDE